jgi:hypothetical protein
MPKTELAAWGSNHDPRTGHLRPVMAFLLARGNRQSHWWPESGFWFDQGANSMIPSPTPSTRRSGASTSPFLPPSYSMLATPFGMGESLF